MKRHILFIAFMVSFTAIYAQAPQLLSYQSVVRNTTGALLANTLVGMRISILQGSSSGTAVYVETQTPTTNSNGLVSISVGGGAVVSGTMAGIDWTAGPYFIKTETDPTGNTSYTITGISQLQSVPYALCAANAPTFSGTADYIPMFTSPTGIGNSVMYQNNNRIGIGTTNPAGIFSVLSASAVDTELVLIRATGHPSTYGTVRMEYLGSTDEAGRVGLLCTVIRAVADVNGIGIEGAGNYQGVYGIGEGSATTGGAEAFGVEGDSYGSGTYSLGVGGFGSNWTSAPTNCYGVYGYASGGTTNYAVYSDGAMRVNGALSKASGTFEIDHPLDPAGKYLYHSFVESPDMMNIYNGNITTDANGMATVALPEYFDTLNKDFRYQLTVIGTFAQAIISKEIVQNSFEIKTDHPNVKVSWMVTGVRKDAWANAHRVVAEVDKAAFDKGKYLHPVELGLPESMRIGADLKKHERTGAELSTPEKK